MDLANCTNANLRKATRAVTQVYDAALQPSGLRATQFALLGALMKRGEMPLTQLADVMVMDRTTLTRNLKLLVEKGLIHIGPGADQRVRSISVTDDGGRAVKEATRHWRKAQSRLVDGLGEARWRSLLDDLAAERVSIGEQTL